MNYKDYVKIQTEGPGHIVKPARYHVAERIAITWLFRDISSDARILDLGCGLGQGMHFLRNLGYSNIFGLELNKDKVSIAKSFGFEVWHGDVELLEGSQFDIIYSSHSFEHMYMPELALGILKKLAAHFFFILPYPDRDPAPPHTASREIGLDIDDGGKSVMKWFEDRELILVDKRLDDFREPEIWLRFIK